MDVEGKDGQGNLSVDVEGKGRNGPSCEHEGWVRGGMQLWTCRVRD